MIERRTLLCTFLPIPTRKRQSTPSRLTATARQSAGSQPCPAPPFPVHTRTPAALDAPAAVPLARRLRRHRHPHRRTGHGSVRQPSTAVEQTGTAEAERSNLVSASLAETASGEGLSGTGGYVVCADSRWARGRSAGWPWRRSIGSWRACSVSIGSGAAQRTAPIRTGPYCSPSRILSSSASPSSSLLPLPLQLPLHQSPIPRPLPPSTLQNSPQSVPAHSLHYLPSDAGLSRQSSPSAAVKTRGTTPATQRA